MDAIQLRGLRAVGIHGLLPEEQGRAQPFEVDIDVEVDLRVAGASDELADSLDYGEVAGRAVAVIEGEPCALLERVAERIARAVLDDDRALSVTVTVRKLRPPVPFDLGHAAVRITRGQGPP